MARYPLRDLGLLLLGGLAARTLAAWLVPTAPYTDAAYYTLVGERLADGFGFTIPVLYSFLEVGGALPADPVLPVDSNGHWMPLTSVVAAGSMTLLGSPDWRAGQVPMVLLSVSWIGLTHAITWDLWRNRRWALVAGVLALFAGPLLILQPLLDSFALFGVLGSLALWASMRAMRHRRWGWWLVLSGALIGLATLTRIDGLLLAIAPAVVWVLRMREVRPALALGIGAAAAIACVAVAAPWLARNMAVYGEALPSAGGHTLWITSYNEQFSIGHEVSLGTYLQAGPGLIIGSKVQALAELSGRTLNAAGGVFALFLLGGLWAFRSRRDLWPFLAYWVVMFLAMGLVFTFHAPKGAFMHTASAWLPMGFAIAVGAVSPVSNALGRWWPFLRRPQAHRFLMAAALGGAVVLSVASSAALLAAWRDSDRRLASAASFLTASVPQNEVVMFADPSRLNLLTGHPSVAAPFDPYSVVESVVRAYDVRWVLVALEPGADRDPLGLWEGAAGVDSTGASPSFLPSDPAFEAEGVRVYRVVD
jgi:4-amino-4-deoxy-L-arabinose transferase-like glycosyltransferase